MLNSILIDKKTNKSIIQKKINFLKFFNINKLSIKKVRVTIQKHEKMIF